jgi:hypothetical protein
MINLTPECGDACGGRRGFWVAARKYGCAMLMPPARSDTANAAGQDHRDLEQDADQLSSVQLKHYISK